MQHLNLVLSDEDKHRTHHPLFIHNYRHAYDYYLQTRALVRSCDINFYGEEGQKMVRLCERQLEVQAEEMGVSETRTGLISEEALKTKVKQYLYGKSSIKKTEALATEHPITKRSVAKFLLWTDQTFDFDEYWAVWNNHLITVVTTNHENHSILQPLQQNFVFGVDRWEDVYAKACIVLHNNPDFRSPLEKQKTLQWFNSIMDSK